MSDISNFLLIIVAFIVTISVLVAVHEFGHYWVARRLGVKVLRFSIGFGNPVWRRIGKDADQVEYVISSIPLGGYVKMLDEREGEVVPEELHRAFNRQPVAKRIAIVAAGPILNLVFAIFSFWLMYMNGVPGLKPEQWPVPAGSVAAAAGMHGGEVIISVDGEGVRTRGDVLEKILPKALLHESVIVVADDGGVKREHTLSFDSVRGDESVEELINIIGLHPFRIPTTPRVGEITADYPAEAAGLRSNDLITAVNGVATPDWLDVVAIISQSPNRAVVVSYERGGVSHQVEVVPRAETVGGKVIGRIGAGHVDQDLPKQIIIEVKYGPLESIPHAAGYVWDNVAFTFKMIGGMLSRQVSTEHLSGVITIATSAKDAAMAGTSAFLRFLGLVSLSLGVLNLLPIPVLDGGHLTFYLVEWIKGSPVSERTQQIGQWIGLSLLITLMMLALYNDLVRVAG